MNESKEMSWIPFILVGFVLICFVLGLFEHPEVSVSDRMFVAMIQGILITLISGSIYTFYKLNKLEKEDDGDNKATTN